MGWDGRQPETSNEIGSADVVDWLMESEAPLASRQTIAPAANVTSRQKAAIEPATKPCPYCAESIQIAARKCRFCGEFLDSRLATASVAHPKEPLKNPGVAAALSFVIPGLGQVYNGQIALGIILGIACALLYMTVILGLILHISLVFMAYDSAKRANSNRV